jgi:hypothetical protein
MYKRMIGLAAVLILALAAMTGMVYADNGGQWIDQDGGDDPVAPVNLNPHPEIFTGQRPASAENPHGANVQNPHGGAMTSPHGDMFSGAVSDGEVPTALGTISGQVVSGSAGGVLPEGTVAQLHIIDANLNEELFEQPLTANGSYTFSDVTIRPDRGYVVTVDHGEGFFASEMIFGDPNVTEHNLNITVYDRTADHSVLRLDAMTSQFDANENGVRVVQLMQFSNTTDQMYINDGGEGRSYSVEITLPENAQLDTEANDMRRMFVSDDGRTISDTQPVLPNEPHIVHIVYTLPGSQTVSLDQPLDYALNGRLEAYARAGQVDLEVSGMELLGNNQMGEAVYATYGGDVSMDAGSSVSYVLHPANLSGSASGGPTSPLQSNTLVFGLLGIGVVLIVVAIYMFFRSSPTTPQPAVAAAGAGGDRGQINALIREIAELDQLYQQNTIDTNRYQQERTTLKDQLARLMKAQGAQ